MKISLALRFVVMRAPLKYQSTPSCDAANRIVQKSFENIWLDVVKPHRSDRIAATPERKPTAHKRLSGKRLDFGGFGNGESSEEPQLNEFCCLPVFRRKPLQRLVDREQALVRNRAPQGQFI